MEKQNKLIINDIIIKDKIEEIKSYYCKTLPRKEGTCCDNCKSCNKLNEIFKIKQQNMFKDSKK